MADNTILTRLDGLKLKYEEIGQKLTDPEVIADVKQFVQLNKEYKELEPIIETSERYRTALANLAEAKDVLVNDKDEEMREMARGEIAELEPAISRMEEEIKLLRDNGVFVAHCPASNTNLSSGIAPIRRYLENYMHVGLGSDIAGGHTESILRAV